MYPHFVRAASALAGGLMLCISPALAQDVPSTADPPRSVDVVEEEITDDEPTLYDQFVERFKTPSFSLGLVVQAVGTFVLEDADAPEPFDIDRARIKLGGQIGGGFGYNLQGDLTRSPALVDARLTYAPAPTLRLLAGRYRVPFSLEETTSSTKIDFVNRARVVRAIAPGRDVGAGVELTTPSEALRFSAGAFNALYDRTHDGEPLGDETSGRLLFAGRLTYHTSSSASSGFRLQVGANASYETPGESDAGDVPTHVIAGADLRLNAGPVLLAAEGLTEYTEADGFEQRRDGYYVTLGYDVHERHRLLARIDAFESSEALLFGYNARLSRAVLIRTNLVVPLDDVAGATTVVVSTQLAF